MLFHDVKSTNIALGRNNEDQIFFFDFAFSEFHVNALGESKERTEAQEINGTPDFMARGPLHRLTNVRKDDFISFGLVMLDLNGVVLPWKEKTKNNISVFSCMDIVLAEWDRYTIEVSQMNSIQNQFLNN